MEEQKEVKSTRGGARENAGRKSVADEQKVNTLFVDALKELYKTNTDDEAKKKFIKETLMDSQRGQLFVAEHVFGKAPQEIKQTNFNIEAKDLDEKEILKIKNALDNAY
jgi:hypothetical protein